MFSPTRSDFSMGKGKGKGKGKEIGEVEGLTLGEASRADERTMEKEKVRTSLDSYDGVHLRDEAKVVGGEGSSREGIFRSLAGAGIQQVMGQFTEPEFHRLHNDLQVISDHIQDLERGKSAEVSALQRMNFDLRSDIHGLRHQLGVQKGLVAQKEAQIQDLSAALTEAQGAHRVIQKLAKEAGDLRYEKVVADIQIRQLIDLLRQSGDVERGIGLLERLVGGNVSAPARQPTVEDASDNGN